MKTVKKWFETFCWLSGINLLCSLIFGEGLNSRPMIISFIVISGIFSIIPESFWDKAKIQLQKDVK